MEWTTYKAKLAHKEHGREMRRFARRHENEAIVRVPEVVGIAVVPVQPQTVIVVFDVEDVAVAVRVGCV